MISCKKREFLFLKAFQIYLKLILVYPVNPV